MTQFQAGFILDSIKQAFAESDYSIEKVSGLLKHLSYFDVQGNANFNKNIKDPDSLVCVASNIISRGLPTIPDTFIEDQFADIYKLTEKRVDGLGSIRYMLNEKGRDLLDDIYKALHIIDPRINGKDQFQTFKESGEALGSEFEENFFFKVIPDELGDEFIQLLEPQRDLGSILYFADTIEEGFEKYLNGTIHNLTEQNVDFSIDFPYQIDEKKGIVIEIDGTQHEHTAQKKLDEMRDDALRKIKWKGTLRIKTTDFHRIHSCLQPLQELKNQDFFEIIHNNYNSPLYETENGLNALHLALAPFGFARIQKTIIELILKDFLKLDATKWKIGIIERDVAVAYLAVEDLKLLFDKLFLLEGNDRQLPEIELKIFNTVEFKGSKLNQRDTCKVLLLDKIDPNEKFDLMIDFSMLKRKTPIDSKPKVKARYNIIIRSTYGIKTRRKFYTDSLIQYAPIIREHGTNTNLNEYSVEKVSVLSFFLQSVFRKNSFWPGQVEILNRALQCKNVVGLLPTGGGKSLTYQLATLLQPGVCLIVDPIKSLMKDQYEGLLRTGIDATVFINSSIRTAWERGKAIDEMCQAEVLFAFISPERMQIGSFRMKLVAMTNELNNYFSYCVVDEAHCVSEWGHDFRTPYLKLGENAVKYCRIKSDQLKNIPILGLTATASFDVLSDVQRELQIDEESIVTSQTLERPELVYKIEKVDVDSFINSTKEFEIKEELGKAKQETLVQLLQDIPFEIEKFNKKNLGIKNHTSLNLLNFDPYLFYENIEKKTHTGLVFCPHKTWVFGVEAVAQKIRDDLNIKLGTFMGSQGDYEKDSRVQTNLSEINQDDFMADKLSMLVATKAFGMGIDKPNIRFTAHLNFPGSIESFYQEAGRAGRDGKLAMCYILFSDHAGDREILESFHNNSFKGPNKERWVSYEILKEITFPADSQSNIIIEALSDEFSIVVAFNFWPKDDPTRLYVKKAYKKEYGYIDLYNMTIYPDTRTFDFHLSQKVLEFVIGKIEEEIPDNINVVQWLKKELEHRSAPGIEALLDEAEVSEKLTPITVGFTNDKFKRITEYLKLNVKEGFTERIIKEASGFCTDSDEFIKNLGRKYYKYNKNGVIFREDQEKKLKELFPKIRDDQDTYKAVYRLSVIGVVDDYDVDYNSKTITLQVTKKADQDYIDHLHNYLSRYFSKERADKVYIDIPKQKGETVIQKCLGYLIDFVYNEIEQKRHKAIDSMEEACIVGLEKGPEALKEHIDIHFNSKYYPFLVKDTKKGKEYSFKLIWNYIKKVGDNIDNLKHLRGACTRLIIENPKNAAIILLKGFSLISLEHRNPDSRLFKEGINSFHEGFLIFKKDKNLNFDNFSEAVYQFIEELIKLNSNLKDLLEEEIELLFLKIHTEWLSNFNDKFLNNYERKNSQRAEPIA